jgi:hypothetical protein
MKTIVKVNILLMMVTFLYLTGCASIGSKSVARERFAYTDAISESWKRQMLLNMVKIRYGDTPVFLDVASVISQFSQETEINGSLSWLPDPGQTLGVRGKFIDRPTITYQPVLGDKFTLSLMTPIPPTAILSLIQAGFRADLVFRICVQSINGMKNRSGGKMETISADRDFYRLTSALMKIQKNAAVGMRIEETENKRKTAEFIFPQKELKPEIAEAVATVKNLLGLSSEQNEFQVVFGAIAKHDQEIAILSRPMLRIIQELASYFEVPSIHVEEKRTMPRVLDVVDIPGVAPSLLHVQSSDHRPDNAFVTAHYRDHWFWIDDRDYHSKSVFTFMMFLLSLAETNASGPAPVITVPAG